LPFFGAWLVEQAAFHVGEWESIFQILHAEKNVKSCHAQTSSKTGNFH